MRSLANDLDLHEVADKIRQTASGWNLEFNAPTIVDQGYCIQTQAPPNNIQQTIDGTLQGSDARKAKRASSAMLSYILGKMEEKGVDVDRIRGEARTEDALRRHREVRWHLSKSRAAEVSVGLAFTFSSSTNGVSCETYLPLTGTVTWRTTLIQQTTAGVYDENGNWQYPTGPLEPPKGEGPAVPLSVPVGQIVRIQGLNGTFVMQEGIYTTHLVASWGNLNNSETLLRSAGLNVYDSEGELVATILLLEGRYKEVVNVPTSNLTIIYDSAIDLGHQQVGELPPVDPQNAAQTNPKVTVTQLKEGHGVSGSAALWNIVWPPVDTEEASPVQLSSQLVGSTLGTGGPIDLFDRNIGYVVVQVIGISQATTAFMEIRIDTEVVAAPESTIAPFMEEQEVVDMQACEIVREIRGAMPWGFDGDRARTSKLPAIFEKVILCIAGLAAKDLGVATQQVVHSGHQGLLGTGLDLFGLGFLKKPIKGVTGVAHGLLNTISNLL